MKSLKFTGKNVDTGDAYKTYVTDKLLTALKKYIGSDFDGHVRLEKSRNAFRTDCLIILRRGLVLESHAEAPDAYESADAAVSNLEKRVRRYKRRLKNHHNDRSLSLKEIPARDYTVQTESIDDSGDHHPVIVAESERGIPELPVSEAVMHLDLTQSSFLVFKNAGHGGMNVVYLRSDGHIGWIDPKPDAAASKPAEASGI